MTSDQEQLRPALTSILSDPITSGPLGLPMMHNLYPFFQNSGDICRSISFNCVFTNICCSPWQVRAPTRRTTARNPPLLWRSSVQQAVLQRDPGHSHTAKERGCMWSRPPPNVGLSHWLSNASFMHLGCIHSFTSSCPLAIGSLWIGSGHFQVRKL